MSWFSRLANVFRSDRLNHDLEMRFASTWTVAPLNLGDVA